MLVLAGCATGPDKYVVESEVLHKVYGGEIVMDTWENQNGRWRAFVGNNPTGSPLCMHVRVEEATREREAWSAGATSVAPGSKADLGWWDAERDRTLRYRIWRPNSQGKCQL